MKKIISLFMLLFAFSFSANAQETSKDNITILVDNDIKSLTEIVKVNNEKLEELQKVFTFKHKSLAQNMHREEEVLLERKISSKIESVLGKEDFLKLSRNKSLLKKLTFK